MACVFFYDASEVPCKKSESCLARAVRGWGTK